MSGAVGSCVATQQADGRWNLVVVAQGESATTTGLRHRLAVQEAAAECGAEAAEIIWRPYVRNSMKRMRET